MFRHKFLSLLMVGALVLSASGCVILAVGAAGVVGGYVISPDTVEGSTAHSFEEVWRAAKEITGIMGQVVEENSAQGMLVSQINATRVTVTLTSINANTTKMTIKARKSFMPKIDLAQDVYAKIVSSFDR